MENNINGNDVKFEQLMQSLDEIVKKLSSGTTPLDEMISLYEEGMEISKKCKKMLDDFDARLDIALKNEKENG